MYSHMDCQVAVIFYVFVIVMYIVVYQMIKKASAKDRAM